MIAVLHSHRSLPAPSRQRWEQTRPSLYMYGTRPLSWCRNCQRETRRYPEEHISFPRRPAKSSKAISAWPSYRRFRDMRNGRSGYGGLPGNLRDVHALGFRKHPNDVLTDGVRQRQEDIHAVLQLVQHGVMRDGRLGRFGYKFSFSRIYASNRSQPSFTISYTSSKFPV